MEEQSIPIGMLLQKAAKIRAHILEMVAEAKSGHPGGSLSAVEILVSLFFYKMRHDPKRPDWPDRDRFVLSKGHAAPVLFYYSCRGWISSNQRTQDSTKDEQPSTGPPR